MLHAKHTIHTVYEMRPLLLNGQNGVLSAVGICKAIQEFRVNVTSESTIIK